MKMGLTGALCITFTVVLAVACDRASREPAAKPATTKAKPDNSVVDTDESYRYRATKRIVAIGDLHGDLDATRRSLRVAQVIDENDTWSGGKTVVVQTGDVLDRGDDERAIMDLFDRLKSEAKKAGGDVHALVGNHEVMNVQGDLRYVTRVGFTSFDKVSIETKQDLSRFEQHARPRAVAFLPGGPYASRLSKLDTIVMVNDTLFVHGGVLPSHVSFGLGKINQQVKSWMRGDRASLPDVMQSSMAPTWNRRFSNANVSAPDCQVLRSVLDKVGAKRMVVGHTPQRGGITSACDQRVWRIDIGVAAPYGSKPAQVLAIDGNKVHILKVHEGGSDARVRDERGHAVDGQ